MKNVLIIEDNALKEARIRAVLSSRSDLKFTTCKSIKVAYPALQMQHWDLILLDMSFQVNQGMGMAIKKEPLAGLEILQYMLSRNIVQPVIVVTQHASFSDGLVSISSITELDIKLRKYFPKLYRGTVHVDLASDAWHDKLITRAAEALSET